MPIDIQRYAMRAGMKTRIGNHFLRATGITEYLESDGLLFRSPHNCDPCRRPHRATGRTVNVGALVGHALRLLGR